MGYPVLIIGESGTGKSSSIRTMSIQNTAIINVQSKPLPFRGGGEFKSFSCDDAIKIKSVLSQIKNKKQIKNVIIDDFQYVMANEFMRRSMERGFDKFTEIGKNAWSIINQIKELPDDMIVTILSHEETDQNGKVKVKTIGKLLDEKITLEGMFSVVLRSRVIDGRYIFTTQNSGEDTVKSPMGMFSELEIDNDLDFVCKTIRDYSDLGSASKPAEAPAEGPADSKPADKPADSKPADTPAEAPAEGPADSNPAEGPAEAPAEATAEAPAEATAEATAEAPAEATADSKSGKNRNVWIAQIIDSLGGKEETYKFLRGVKTLGEQQILSELSDKQLVRLVNNIEILVNIKNGGENE